MDIRILYELKRQNFLIGYIQSPKHFDAALAYAYEHRIAPVFHEEIAREKYGEDLFKEVYDVSADFMDEVYAYMDECDLNKKLDQLAFYKLEDKFGGYKRNRLELIRTIEYARVSGRFGDDVYKAIEKDAPAEANRIDDKFEPKDVHFG